MIREILIPDKNKKTCIDDYNRHCSFFFNYARFVGIHVEVAQDPRIWISDEGEYPCEFSCLIDGKQFIVDYSDYLSYNTKNTTPGVRHGKYYYYEMAYRGCPHFYPLGSQLDIQGYDFSAFFELCNTPRPNNSTMIRSNQNPRLNALERRSRIQINLLKWYGEKADVGYNYFNQKDFWIASRDSLVSIVVPGATNNAIDRGHLEQLALGVCTISPRIDTFLPYFMKPEPGISFFQCRDDYSDLRQIIDWCIEHPVQCYYVGQKAQELFNSCFTPEKYFSWVEQIVKEQV